VAGFTTERLLINLWLAGILLVFIELEKLRHLLIVHSSPVSFADTILKFLGAGAPYKVILLLLRMLARLSDKGSLNAETATQIRSWMPITSPRYISLFPVSRPVPNQSPPNRKSQPQMQILHCVQEDMPLSKRSGSMTAHPAFQPFRLSGRGLDGCWWSGSPRKFPVAHNPTANFDSKKVLGCRVPKALLNLHGRR
jgi:hypothetical protein